MRSQPCSAAVSVVHYASLEAYNDALESPIRLHPHGTIITCDATTLRD